MREESRKDRERVELMVREQVKGEVKQEITEAMEGEYRA